MTDTISEHDFIEIDYTGKLTDGTIFDTTKEEVAHEANMPHTHGNLKSVIVCLGESQLLPGLDEFLVGKEVGKSLSVTLSPEKAFGKRDVKKVKIVPVTSIEEVLEAALEWDGKKRIKEMIVKNGKKKK